MTFFPHCTDVTLEYLLVIYIDCHEPNQMNGTKQLTSTKMGPIQYKSENIRNCVEEKLVSQSVDTYITINPELNVIPILS